MSVGITAAETKLRAVAFRSARIAVPIHTMQIARARRMYTALARTVSTASGRAPRAERRAGTSCLRCSAARGHARAGYVEREALVTGSRAKAQTQHQARQHTGKQRAARGVQGATVNRRASLAAKPLG